MKLFQICFFLTIFIFGAKCIEIDCEYQDYSWIDTFNDFESKTYYCSVKNPELITSKDNREITSVRGKQDNSKKAGRTDDDVEYFYAKEKKIFYIPRNLTNVFKNIVSVEFISTGLRELKKEDLRQFGDKLRVIIIVYNDIEVIEGDLFDYNRNLKHFYLPDNKLTSVDSRAFSGLDKLISFDIRGNPCWQDNRKGAEWNRREALEYISEVDEECPTPAARSSRIIWEFKLHI